MGRERRRSRPALLRTPLGASRLLARPGDRRLWVLDVAASALWDLHASGLAPGDLAGLVASRFALPAAAAQAQVRRLIAQWRRAGLLERAPPAPGLRLDQAGEPVMPRPQGAPRPDEADTLLVADRALAWVCDDASLRARLGAWLAGARPAAPAAWVDHRLCLQGGAPGWRLTLDEVVVEQGAGADAALVATLAVLTELGCRPAERLLVLHGAGLVAPDGRGLLLVAPGGAGKSTLAAALDATGCGLLSDDVVPVDLHGKMLALRLPLCLKPGSWPVLSGLRPELGRAPEVQRYGARVRYLPPLTPAAARPHAAQLLLVPRHKPRAAPSRVPLTPEQALADILAAEAVIRDLDQAKLEALARWVEGLSAYRLTYPDLAVGLALVRDLLDVTPETLALHPHPTPTTSTSGHWTWQDPAARSPPAASKPCR